MRTASLIVVALAALGSGDGLAADDESHWNLQEPARIEWRAAENLPPGALGPWSITYVDPADDPRRQRK